VKCDGEKTAKALYLSIMFFSTVLAAVMRYNGSSIVGDLSEITGACNGNSLDSVQDNNSSSCEGNQAVYVFFIGFVVVVVLPCIVSERIAPVGVATTESASASCFLS
jgi:hypothetical protein